MEEKENKVTLTKEELDEILRNLPEVLKDMEKKIKEQENIIQPLKILSN